MQRNQGLSVIEVLVAVAIFTLFATGATVAVLSGFQANRLGTEETIAHQFATQGIEAARSIKNQSFSLLSSTSYPNGTGIAQNAQNVWSFAGDNTTTTFGKYTLKLFITDVNRDANGNIVPAPNGTFDQNTKRVLSTVSWNAGGTRNNTVNLTTYYTNWKSPLSRGGLLVYGDGSTTSNATVYSVYNPTSSTWGTPATITLTGIPSAMALRAVRVYASSTRNEKILLARFVNASTNVQTIYATVFNGSSWNKPTQFASWTSSSFFDVQNFDGAYLNNGNFIVIYSDNTSVPKSQLWNGAIWQSQPNLTDLGSGQIPTYIIALQRPNTSEIMAVFFTQASNTITQYFNGSSWSPITIHATFAPNNSERMVDFAWSPQDTTKGGLVFTNNSGDKGIHIKIFTADGSGSGKWSTTANSTQNKKGVGAVAIVGRAGANEFQACYKNDITSKIFCFISDFTPTISNPTNQQITAITDSNIERSYHLSYETVSGDPALIVYSDSTSIPKLKKYTASSSTWDSTTTSISTSPLTLGIVKAVRIIPQDMTNDMLILLTDANRHLYSVMWDGTNNVIYTNPPSKAFTAQGSNGSANNEFWFDFAWDKF